MNNVIDNANKIYNQLNLDDNAVTGMKLHSFQSMLYRANCSQEEVRVFMKWRRNAQSRKHPNTCKRKQITLESDIEKLQTERDRLARERRGLLLEIESMVEALSQDNRR